MASPRPYNLIAELTYRCPLRCPYCSNPLQYAQVREGLDAEAWGAVFREASALGCLHVGLTGGEPSVREDLEAIVAHASEAQLFAHLVTAGLPLGAARLGALARAGLRSVQLSIQDATAAPSDRIAGTASFERKLAVARRARELELPLVVNVVLHRANIDAVEPIVELAASLGATRVELAHTQYHGWAFRNRAALMPTRGQIENATRSVERLRARAGQIAIDLVLPDYFRGRPKACMGGWGSRAMVITPRGQVLPCHGAAELPDLEFWTVPERPLQACWEEAPGMNAYRGIDWMPEPCRSCPEKTRDFGGCRCQAHQLAGAAGATDPACDKSPLHAAVRTATEEVRVGEAGTMVYRGGAAVPESEAPA